MQYIAGNTIPTCSYHSVTPNAPSSVGGGGVSEAESTLSVVCDVFTEHSLVKLEIKSVNH